jgi:alpha-galactosidase
MAILFNREKQIFKIDTRNTSYVFSLFEKQYLVSLYYGKRVEDSDLRYLHVPLMRSFSPYMSGLGNTFSLNTARQEFSSNGTGDFRLSSVAAENGCGNSCVRFIYQSHRIFEGREAVRGMPHARPAEGVQTLEITLFDAVINCTLYLYYTVYENTDTLCRHTVIKNCGGKPVTVEKLMSAMLDLPNQQYELLHLAGVYGNERLPVREKLTQGIKILHSNKGTSAHQTNPFAAVLEQSTTENSGNAYGIELVYSGSFYIGIEKEQYGTVRLCAGINPENFRYVLSPEETFYAPEAVLTFSDKGIGQLSRNFHDHLRQNIIDPKWAEAPRPVVFNSWEVSYFDINEKSLLDYARAAKALGIDTLVIDDGWFGKRNDDTVGLGDWYVNREKFSEGLGAFSEKVNKIGLKFGIWIEPEMVNPQSDLFEAHPDWVLKCPHRENSVSREQLVLDICNADVRAYLVSSLEKAFRGVNLSYIKWDMNRYLTEIGSTAFPVNRQKELSHRYVLSVYELLDAVTKLFPNAMIESCSGGGGRFDAGMLYYSPQIWTSDNTDPFERAHIQHGTSLAYPPSAISCHVSATPSGGTQRLSSMDFRHHIAFNGVLGYELCLLKLSSEEKTKIVGYIKKYREIERLILSGDYYRLDTSSAEGRAVAYSHVAKDKRQAVAVYAVLSGKCNEGLHVLKPEGLDPNCLYKETFTGLTLSGAAFMSAGVTVPFTYGDGNSFLYHFIAVSGK